MKNKIINGCMTLIEQSNNDLSKKQKDKIRYGLEGLYLTITKLIIITIVAYFIGILKEYLILLVLFNGIRLFGFGVHAKKSSHCLISSLLFFIIFPLLAKIIYIPILLKKIIFIPLILLIGIYAPADTQKRPLKNKKKRFIYKILTIIIALIYMILSIYIKNNTISNCLIFSIIIQIIIINPITYKIFGVSYNNYKNYEVNI
jgi:accessory gene regulator B